MTKSNATVTQTTRQIFAFSATDLLFREIFPQRIQISPKLSNPPPPFMFNLILRTKDIGYGLRHRFFLKFISLTAFSLRQLFPHPNTYFIRILFFPTRNGSATSLLFEISMKIPQIQRNFPADLLSIRLAEP